MTAGKIYRYSGHETFPCRYAWLPKAAQAVAAEGNQDIFTSAREDDAMVQLGVGKNMVRSIKFWAEASDIIHPADTGHTLTDLGRELFIGTNGLPPIVLWLNLTCFIQTVSPHPPSTQVALNPSSFSAVRKSQK